jgi:hypothetical protein
LFWVLGAIRVLGITAEKSSLNLEIIFHTSSIIKFVKKLSHFLGKPFPKRFPRVGIN